MRALDETPPPEAPDVGGEHSTSSAPSLDPNSVDFGRDLRNPSRITPLQRGPPEFVHNPTLALVQSGSSRDRGRMEEAGPRGPFNKRKRGANDNHDEEGPGATPPLAPPSKRQKEGKFHSRYTSGGHHGDKYAESGPVASSSRIPALPPFSSGVYEPPRGRPRRGIPRSPADLRMTLDAFDAYPGNKGTFCVSPQLVSSLDSSVADDDLDELATAPFASFEFASSNTRGAEYMSHLSGSSYEKPQSAKRRHGTEQADEEDVSGSPSKRQKTSGKPSKPSGAKRGPRSRNEVDPGSGTPGASRSPRSQRARGGGQCEIAPPEGFEPCYLWTEEPPRIQTPSRNIATASAPPPKKPRATQPKRKTGQKKTVQRARGETSVAVPLDEDAAPAIRNTPPPNRPLPVRFGSFPDSEDDAEGEEELPVLRARTPPTVPFEFMAAWSRTSSVREARAVAPVASGSASPLSAAPDSSEQRTPGVPGELDVLTTFSNATASGSKKRRHSEDSSDEKPQVAKRLRGEEAAAVRASAQARRLGKSHAEPKAHNKGKKRAGTEDTEEYVPSTPVRSPPPEVVREPRNRRKATHQEPEEPTGGEAANQLSQTQSGLVIRSDTVPAHRRAANLPQDTQTSGATGGIPRKTAAESSSPGATSGEKQETGKPIKMKGPKAVKLPNGRWLCGWDGCTESCLREHDVQRHRDETTAHGSVKPKFYCSDCGKGFQRKDAMIRHEETLHNLYRPKKRKRAEPEEEEEEPEQKKRKAAKKRDGRRHLLRASVQRMRCILGHASLALVVNDSSSDGTQVDVNIFLLGCSSTSESSSILLFGYPEKEVEYGSGADKVRSDSAGSRERTSATIVLSYLSMRLRAVQRIGKSFQLQPETSRVQRRKECWRLRTRRGKKVFPASRDNEIFHLISHAVLQQKITRLCCEPSGPYLKYSVSSRIWVMVNNTHGILTMYTWLSFIIDDKSGDMGEDVELFQQRFLEGTPQPTTLLQHYAEILRTVYKYYDSVVANFIIQSSLSSITCCLLETRKEYKETPQREAGASPKGTVRTYQLSSKLFPTSPSILIWGMTFCHDFYKEELQGETNNYIHMRARYTKKDPVVVLQEVVEETVAAQKRVSALLDGQGGIEKVWHTFWPGYITFHGKVSRYCLDQIGIGE
ncbi:hypothetical protein C8J57DRAFT_1236262 [Mycena rebaudengoi]|nr:hypothetical protein C8J57DRAFT_1236262 [Mycena rebaudengoi]